MTGDFTRDSFDPLRNFTRVLMQQGRPQLDADWNEQVAIFWQYWRTFVADLVGPYAGPDGHCGFGVVTPSILSNDPGLSNRLGSMLKESGDFLIGPGHYYVDGIRCENHRYLTYSGQLHPSECCLSPKANASYLVYLDVWERTVTSLEDDWIREPALNGIDTCVRTKVAWRVRTWELQDKEFHGASGPECSKVREHWAAITHHWQAEHRGLLRAGTSEAHGARGGSAEPELAPPESGYRGPQNQLYRVEIHHDGSVGGSGGPTFKVSRENGSVTFRIIKIEDKVVTLDSMGHDARFGLSSGDWVEICAAEPVPGSAPGTLWLVEQVVPDRRQLVLKGTPSLGGHHTERHPLLRRWDHKAGDPHNGGLELRDGAAVLKEGDGNNGWLSLENGLRIQFQKSTPANRYRSGDYWRIPARVVIGGVLWPSENGKPKALAPHGVQHYYAPLAIVSFTNNGILETQADCRPMFKLPIVFGY
jgi:hypothetical protein